MRQRLKIVLFCALGAMGLGLVDYLVGLYYSIYELRSEGLVVLAKSLVASQGCYLAAGAAFGLVMALAFWASSAARGQRSRQAGLSGKLIGVLTGAFTALLMEAFTNIHTDWKMFLDFVFFVPIGVLTGLGVDFLWEQRIKRLVMGPVRAIFIIYLALLCSASFSTTWALKFSLSTKGKFLMVLLSAAVFLVMFALARAAFLKKTKTMIAACALAAMVLLCLPVTAIRPKPIYARLGAPKHKLNVILIIADACRADALSIYGGKNPTPNLDRLAKEGVLFKNAFSQAPWTLPSMLSMLSSMSPSLFKDGQPFHAGSEFEFFPERLKGYGYHTEAVISNYLLAGSSGILQGLDQSEVIHNRFRLQKLLFHPVVARTYYLFRRLAGLSQLPDHTAMMTADAANIIKNSPDPFFLWVHYMNPHEPYNPPDKYLRQVKYQGFLRPPFFPNDPYAVPGDLSHPQEMDVKLGYIFFAQKDKDYVRDLYLAQLRYLDDKVGELMQELKASGKDKNTIVVFASDHGEEFWEHDNFGHGASLYDELLHVPLIIWGGGLKPREVMEQVEMLDLVPSLADLMGIAANPDWQGKSFGSELMTGDAVSARTEFAEGLQRPEEMKAIREGDYKLVVRLLTGKVMLFNLKDDPEETKNLAPAKPDLVKELRGRILNWTEDNLSLRAKFRSAPLTAEQRKEMEERMRAAGYIK
jgi:arylsulfatase A-like enzyme